jgi:protein-tyrosine phosphatase
LILTQNSKLKTKNLTVDYHCHLLPGIDDGPDTIAESIEMARALADAGYTTVCCTPHHIRGVYENTPAMVREATRVLQQALDDARIALTLVPGREYYLDEFLLDDLAEPLLLPGNLLLVEASRRCDRQFLAETLYQVVRQGITPLIAHPERCELFATKVAHKNNSLNKLFDFVGSAFNSKLKTQHSSGPQSGSKLDEPSLLVTLRSMGCQFQGNLGSFAGFYGERARASAGQLREMGLYSCFGSDGHSAEGLKAVLSFEF